MENAMRIICMCFSLMLCGEAKIKLALDWWPNPNHVPLFVGKEEGIFAKNGIDIELIYSYDPPHVIQLLNTNQADVVIYYTPQILRLASKQKNLCIVGTLIDQPLQGILVRKNARNFRILGANDFLFERIIEKLEIRQKNLNEQKETHCLNYMHFKPTLRFSEQDAITALILGVADAAFGVYDNIEGVMLRHKGIETEFIPTTALAIPPFPELIFVANKQFVSLSTKELSYFQKALEESVDWCLKHPDQAFEVYLKNNPEKTKETIQWEREAWNKTMPLLTTSQKALKEKFTSFANWMKKEKLFHGSELVESLFFQAFNESRVLPNGYKEMHLLKQEQPLLQ